MADLKQQLLQDLLTDLQKSVDNAKTLDKLIILLDDETKTLTRKKIDKALAQSLRHANITNARIIRLLSYVINSPEQNNNPFSSMFGGTKGPF